MKLNTGEFIIEQRQRKNLYYIYISALSILLTKKYEKQIYFRNKYNEAHL